MVSVDNLADSFENDWEYDLYKKENERYVLYHLRKGTVVTPQKIYITGHPDVDGISYDLQITFSDKEISDAFTKKVKHILKNSVLLSKDGHEDNIYAGSWFFDQACSHRKKYRCVPNIIDKKLGFLLLAFNPMFIWIFLFIAWLQYYYLRKSYQWM